MPLPNIARGVLYGGTRIKNPLNGLGDQFGSPSPLYDLLDGFYMRTEPNAIRRMQLVQAEIERMGLPADMQVFQDFLTSSSKLQRLQNLSFAIAIQKLKM